MSEAAQNQEKQKMDYREDKSSTMLENWQGYTSSIRKTKNLKNLSKQSKKETRNSFGTASALQDGDKKACEELRETVLTNLQGSVWNLLFREITKITPQREREFNSLTHYNVVHKIVPILQAMKILDAKAAVNKELEKLEKIHSCVVDE